jgi:uncharacterized protein YneF (UPF0154 family)
MIAEAAVIGMMVAGEKAIQSGKLSPAVVKQIQRRVEEHTGRRPSKAQVAQILEKIDPNMDRKLTETELTDIIAGVKANRGRRNVQ